MHIFDYGPVSRIQYRLLCKCLLKYKNGVGTYPQDIIIQEHVCCIVCFIFYFVSFSVIETIVRCYFCEITMKFGKRLKAFSCYTLYPVCVCIRNMQISEFELVTKIYRLSSKWCSCILGTCRI